MAFASNSTLSVFMRSVEIELKMDWQGCKRVYYFQILHLIDRWDQHGIKNVLNGVLISCLSMCKMSQFKTCLHPCQSIFNSIATLSAWSHSLAFELNSTGRVPRVLRRIQRNPRVGVQVYAKTGPESVIHILRLTQCSAMRFGRLISNSLLDAGWSHALL